MKLQETRISLPLMDTALLPTAPGALLPPRVLVELWAGRVMLIDKQLRPDATRGLLRLLVSGERDLRHLLPSVVM